MAKDVIQQDTGEKGSRFHACSAAARFSAAAADAIAARRVCACPPSRPWAAAVAAMVRQRQRAPPPKPLRLNCLRVCCCPVGLAAVHDIMRRDRSLEMMTNPSADCTVPPTGAGSGTASVERSARLPWASIHAVERQAPIDFNCTWHRQRMAVDRANASVGRCKGRRHRAYGWGGQPRG